ncbi:MAG: S-layer protein [Candidatus Altiarchaeales archaeon]|nr:S-layer protein [Candidatus Altiarchaeales archaeon]
MKTLRKIGTIAAGAVMLGAALSSAVSAGLDATGLSKGFFYDANYNPIVQIVVGQNGLAPDSVAAGSIAAVIGNLAYSTKQTTLSLDPTAQGKVVLGVSARGASGKYEQADHGSSAIYGSVPLIAFDTTTNARSGSEPSSFYKDNEGLNWTYGDPTLYEKGEFVTYSLSCETQRTDAGILKEATYNNIHCLFCETLCLEQLENPEHEMAETIWVDWPKLKWFEDGINSKDAEALTLKIPSRALEYRVDTQCIPMEKLEKGDETVDFEWRGKMLLFGEEYYVKNVKGYDKIYLSKGKVLDDVTSEGYTSEYLGYKFKIDHLIYSAEFQVAGILLDVEKPDGTVVQTQLSKLANGVVDSIEVAGEYAEEADTTSTATVIAYDRESDVLLEQGKDIELGGEVKKYWKVSFGVINANASDDITEYSSVTGKCLDNLTIQYRHSVNLAEGESLAFPSTFILTFDGYRKTSDYNVVPCSGAGEGNIQIEKVENFVGLLSFTGDDGQRYDGVRMDNGPFETGEMFILGGNLYEYDSYEQDQQTTNNTMKVVLRDVLNGGKTTYRIPAYYGSGLSFNSSTYSFEEAAENDETELVEVDTNINDTTVFYGTIEGIDAWWIEDTLSFGAEAAGLDGGTFGAFSKFDDSGNTLTMRIVNENGTFDMNKDGNSNDRLIVLSNEQGEYAVVDLYDRSYNSSSSSTAKYKEGAVSTDRWSNTAGVPTANISAKLDDEDDTLLVLPDGGTEVTLDYGSNTQVNSFQVCHPVEEVKATAFIGTSEDEIMLEAVITKDDEGKEQTVGCCTYTVKEFAVSAAEVSETVNEITPSDVNGGLVVSDVEADLSKNLIIVGGPAVNSLSTTNAAELEEADDQYIVRKDGSKLIVAGYDAKNTVAAGNALIAWLRENAHA